MSAQHIPSEASAAKDETVRVHCFPKLGTTNISRATVWTTYCRPDEDWSSLKSLSSPQQICSSKNKTLCDQNTAFTKIQNINTFNCATGAAKWDHIKQFHLLDKLNPHFVNDPTITEKHINPNAKQKMRVKSTAQIFSHTVTADILVKVAISTNDNPLCRGCLSAYETAPHVILECEGGWLARSQASNQLTHNGPNCTDYVRKKEYITITMTEFND